MEKIKPCPFCGCVPGNMRNSMGMYFIRCQNCHAETRPFTNRDEAVKFWNTRPEEEEIRNYTIDCFVNRLHRKYYHTVLDAPTYFAIEEVAKEMKGEADGKRRIDG